MHSQAYFSREKHHETLPPHILYYIFRSDDFTVMYPILTCSAWGTSVSRTSNSFFVASYVGAKLAMSLPPPLPKSIARGMVSLLVKNTTINLIFVCSIAWAAHDVLGRVIGALGALIREGIAFWWEGTQVGKIPWF